MPKVKIKDFKFEIYNDALNIISTHLAIIREKQENIEDYSANTCMTMGDAEVLKIAIELGKNE